MCASNNDQMENYIIFTLAALLLCPDCASPQSQSCDRGNFWDTEKQTCEKCDIGSYQDMLGDYNNTTCKQCPALTTTWIKGATYQFYCKIDCPLGTEYSFQFNNCSLCPVGQFRNASLKFCYFCPEDYTTVNSGSTTCTRTTTESSNQKINLTINLSFTIGICENVNHMSTVVKNNIHFLLRHQRSNYNEMCPTDGCENIKIGTSGICQNNDRALAQLDFINIQEKLLNKVLNLYRNCVSVVLESFYDMTIINDSLGMFYGCSSGQVLKPNGSCEVCQEGYFSNAISKQCEKCPKNTYSSTPVGHVCIPCPQDQETNDAGSSSASHCKPKDVNKTIIIAACAGGGGLLCIVVVIVIIICCKRKQQRREETVQSQRSSKSPQKGNSLQHPHRANSNKYVNPRQDEQQQYFHDDTSHYVYGNHGYNSHHGYNLPSKHKWETESLHDYKNPGFILETPDQKHSEENIYCEIVN